MPVSCYRVLFFTFIAVLLSCQLEVQSQKSADPELDSLSGYIQTKYGLDQELYSGLLYYKRFVQYKGNPYFPEDSFYEGYVSIRGVAYENVRLKYDIFSQYLILEYTDFQERYNQLILNNIHIDSFMLGKYHFQNISMLSEKPLFYQVFSSGSVTCYIYWVKDIHSTSDDLQFSHEYTGALGTYYLSYRGAIWNFSSRNTFTSIFPESMHGEIKRYLRQQNLSFRAAGPNDIQNLIIYINQLENTPSAH